MPRIDIQHPRSYYTLGSRKVADTPMPVSHACLPPGQTKWLGQSPGDMPGDLTVTSLHPGPGQAMSFTQRKPMVAQRSRPGYISSIFSWQSLGCAPLALYQMLPSTLR